MTKKEILIVRKILETEKNRLKEWAESEQLDTKRFDTIDEQYETRHVFYNKAVDIYYDFKNMFPTPTEKRLNKERNFRRHIGLMD